MVIISIGDSWLVCCAAGCRAHWPARLLILPAAVEAAGSRAAVGRRGAIASATLEAGETAAYAARRSTSGLRLRGLVVHDR